MHQFLHHPSNKPFHTHEYASAASGTSMGASSVQSFQERSQIDNNRQLVGKYHQSATANNLKGRVLSYGPRGTVTAPRQYVPPAMRQQQLGGGAQQARPRATFVEPPTRGYNPYG